MNQGLNKLQRYPFERLKELIKPLKPNASKSLIDLSIGEPKTPLPNGIKNVLLDATEDLSSYPATKGNLGLREAIAGWVSSRFGNKKNILNPDDEILPVNGTREALFSVAQTFLDPNKKKLVAMPNPFYQIYEGATLLAGGEPYYLNCTEETGFKPVWRDIPAEILKKIGIVYICSPYNPAGSVMTAKDYKEIIELSQKFNFIIIADECYSEIYPEEKNPPLGLLEHCVKFNFNGFKNILVLNSLSKRSGLPGLRSGFIAGDKDLIRKYYSYRTYQGGAMPPHTQKASIFAWNDEYHVRLNRGYYQKNLNQGVKELSNISGFTMPKAGFFFWIKISHNDLEITKRLFSEESLIVLPGQFLARENLGENPGKSYLRVAMVHDSNKSYEAVSRLARFLKKYEV